MVLACRSASMRPCVHAFIHVNVRVFVCTCVYHSVYMHIFVWRSEYDYMGVKVYGYYTTIVVEINNVFEINRNCVLLKNIGILTKELFLAFFSFLPQNMQKICILSTATKK